MGRSRARLWWCCGVLIALTASAEPSESSAQASSPTDPTAAPWKFGMSTALSGATQAIGQQCRAGVEAYFHWRNGQGGVAGRPLQLIALDDGYEPARAAIQMRNLIDREHVFAVVGNVGTPTAAVSVPIVNEKHVPLFGALTGASLLRKNPPDRYVINFRASYVEETAEMVRGLIQERGLDPKDLAFFTQNDAYGDAGFEAAVKALTALGFPDGARLPHGRYPRNTVDVEDAVSRLIDPLVNSKAVIMVGTYRPCAKFIKLVRAHGLRPIFVNISFVGSESLAQELGEAGDGVVVTQVVPLLDSTLPLVQEYHQAVPPEGRSFVSLEGFAAARALARTLETLGPHPTAEAFVDRLEAGTEIDLGFGGAPARLSTSEHQLSHRVWPTVIHHGAFEPVSNWKALTP